jgi:hypothetical protein
MLQDPEIGIATLNHAAQTTGPNNVSTPITILLEDELAVANSLSFGDWLIDLDYIIRS